MRRNFAKGLCVKLPALSEDLVMDILYENGTFRPLTEQMAKYHRISASSQTKFS